MKTLANAMAPPERKPKHPMRVVTRRTGLRADLIRAWERRHGVIEPTRTPGNRRMYTEEDVQRLLLIRRALDVGFHIGNVAPLDNDEIERLIATDSSASSGSRLSDAADTRVKRHLKACFEHIISFDGPALERQLDLATVELSRIELLDRLLVPLMEEVGSACAEGRCRIANEHMASSIVRSRLDTIRGAYPAAETAPCIVVATPASQHHELPAMVVAATARAEGWRTTYLGANLPAEDIVAAVEQCRSRALALSVTWPEDDPAVATELERIGRLLPRGVTVIAGGRSVGGYREVLDEIGAHRPADLAAFRAFLNELRSAGRGTSAGS